MTIIDRMRDSGLFYLMCAIAMVGGLVIAAQVFGGPSDVQLQMEQDRALAQKLHTDLQVVRSQMAAKTEITMAVIKGDLSLLEAAGQFRRLDRQHPLMNWSAFRRAYEGASDEERHCRAVIRHVTCHLEETYSAARICDRLEAELDGFLALGPLYLPDSSSARYGTASRETTKDEWDRLE